MKILLLTIVLYSLNSAHSAPPHLDLEMTSKEYERHLKQLGPSKEKEIPSIEEGLKLGLRLSKWIAKLNESRNETAAIRLTSPETRRGIPISKPNIYSPETIKKETSDILAILPEDMKIVLLGDGALPIDLTVDEETFIKIARRIDNNYQLAARYKSLDVNRNYYTRAAYKDVRGYYYLLSNKIGNSELRNISLLDPEKNEALKEALVGICFNSISNRKSCQIEMEKAQSSNTLVKFHDKYITASKKIWNDFFVIPKYARRSDIIWSKEAATVPFNHPPIEKFVPYLQLNIEDEFKWNGWGLKLSFGNYENGPLLIFREGVVPHVNGLGGNQIVMDSNQPIEEYESQWTIRHEFGHVLGLPDCYHEFYDVNLKGYVNYQLDTTDLMCSRAGNMNERIYNELVGAYE